MSAQEVIIRIESALQRPRRESPIERLQLRRKNPRRRNPNNDIALGAILLGVIGAGLLIGHNKGGSTDPTGNDPVKPPDKRGGAPAAIKIPPNVNAQMLNAWANAGKPTNEDAWISAMQLVVPLTYNQWDWVWRQVYGHFRYTSGWVNGDQVQAWVEYAAAYVH